MPVFRFAVIGAVVFGLGMLSQQSPQSSHRSEKKNEDKPMAFSLVAAGDDCKGCMIINADGDITDETARDFALFLAQLRTKSVLPPDMLRSKPVEGKALKVVVAFQSVGGAVSPALVIGRRIRELGWTTVIGQAKKESGHIEFGSAYCYSACSMVVLGGKERLIVPGSKPGIHQFVPDLAEDEKFSTDEVQEIIREYGQDTVAFYDYTKEMGVDPSFFVSTLRTSSSSLDVLPKERWLSTGLATRLLLEKDPLEINDVVGEVKSVAQTHSALESAD